MKILGIPLKSPLTAIDCFLLEELTGNTMDWAKGEVGIPFALSFELRDNGEFGFLLPAEQIEPSGKEILNGFLVMLEGVWNKTMAF